MKMDFLRKNLVGEELEFLEEFEPEIQDFFELLDEKLLESIKLTKPCACILKPFGRKELISNIEIALHKNDESEEKDLIPKNEALDNSYTFFGMIAALLASAMPFKEKGTFLIQFSRLFEENMKSGFMNDLEKLKSNNEKRNLNVYLACLSRMLSNLGFTNNRMSSGSKGYMIISKCPWKNERHYNDIFCMVCQSITQITLSWMDVEGKVNMESSFLSGATFCRFRFQLE